MDSNNEPHQHHHVAKIFVSLLHQVQIRTLQGLPQPIEIKFSLTNHERRINHLVGKMALTINLEIIGVQNLVRGQDLIDQDRRMVDLTDLPELKDRDLMDPDLHV